EGRDDRDVDRRASAIKPQIKKAERDRGLISLFFGAMERLDDRRRDQGHLALSHAVEIRSDRRTHDPDLDFGIRVGKSDLLAQLALFRWIVADDECDSNHEIPPWLSSRAGFAADRTACDPRSVSCRGR